MMDQADSHPLKNRGSLAFCHALSYTVGASLQQYATRSSHGMPPN
jgi:hypothetical protein